MRNYVRKTERPVISEEDLDTATKQVISGSLSLTKAAKKFNIHFMTLYRSVKKLKQSKKEENNLSIVNSNEQKNPNQNLNRLYNNILLPTDSDTVANVSDSFSIDNQHSDEKLDNSESIILKNVQKQKKTEETSLQPDTVNEKLLRLKENYYKNKLKLKQIEIENSQKYYSESLALQYKLADSLHSIVTYLSK